MEKNFLEDFKSWVKDLEKIEFSTDEKTKLQLIVNLLIKFIFIHTLDNFSVIENNFIVNKWAEVEHNLHKTDKFRIMSKFLISINESFSNLFASEFFNNFNTIIDNLKQDSNNLELFYQNFKRILGIG
ncbi:MAG: hypothetical protein EU532_12275 [Promethearchaeota archaeon]|nr:MAG: hypothetical protein EU532_12275 [Candidatus Lokiarchaeota archaeon]